MNAGSTPAISRLAASDCKLLALVSFPSSSLAFPQLRSKMVWGMGQIRSSGRQL